MRIDDVDPDERDDRTPWRRRLVILAVVAAIAAGVVAVVATRGDDPPAAVDTVPETDGPVITDPPPPVDDVDGPDLNGFPDWGSDYIGPRLDLLHQRVTEAGIRITVHDNGNWGPEVFGAGPLGEVAVPAGAATDTVPGALSPWEPEPWCTPVGGFRVAMVFNEAVGVASGQRYAEPRDGLAVSLFTSGYAEGRPFRVLVLQLGDDVTEVGVVWADGAADLGAPTGGWLALATPGEPSGEFTLTVRTAEGAREVAWQDIPRDGDDGWTEGCTPPPPELPPPGEQPDDPEAAEAEIVASFELLWDTDVEFADKGELVLDDVTGVEEAVDAVMTGGFAEAARSAVHTIRELVFVSPDEAWFRYDIDTSAGDFNDRFGIAYRIDGVWKITRAVMCQDLSLAGGQCIPFVQPIQPPAG